ncbi:hypothetical protein NPIL_111931, partial [Nephila pilipes]
MKCSKKKAVIGLVPVVIAVATLIACAYLFFPKFETITPPESSTDPLCDGTDCSNI